MSTCQPSSPTNKDDRLQCAEGIKVQSQLKLHLSYQIAHNQHQKCHTGGGRGSDEQNTQSCYQQKAGVRGTRYEHPQSILGSPELSG